VIRYQLPVVERSGASLYNVSLKIYNLLGQVVTTLVNETQEAGYKSASFDASKMPSGLYFYWLTAHRQDGVQSGQFMDVKKMLLLR
jgi:flagellar hook assembly protein FlgD